MAGITTAGVVTAMWLADIVADGATGTATHAATLTMALAGETPDAGTGEAKASTAEADIVVVKASTAEAVSMEAVASTVEATPMVAVDGKMRVGTNKRLALSTCQPFCFVSNNDSN